MEINALLLVLSCMLLTWVQLSESNKFICMTDGQGQSTSRFTTAATPSCHHKFCSPKATNSSRREKLNSILRIKSSPSKFLKAQMIRSERSRQTTYWSGKINTIMGMWRQIQQLSYSLYQVHLTLLYSNKHMWALAETNRQLRKRLNMLRKRLRRSRKTKKRKRTSQRIMNKTLKRRHKSRKRIVMKPKRINRKLKRKLKRRRTKLNSSNQMKSLKRRNHVSAQSQFVRMSQLSPRRIIVTNSNTMSKVSNSAVKHVNKLHNRNNCSNNLKTKSVKLKKRLKPRMILSLVFMTSDDHTIRSIWRLSERHKKLKTWKKWLINSSPGFRKTVTLPRKTISSPILEMFSEPTIQFTIEQLSITKEDKQSTRPSNISGQSIRKLRNWMRHILG